ncbi:glycine betaine ABC transporter substrate-binding protein [Chroococcus sp. FPU101]|uniref:glycine betaine ABC transporter substrate-binding protein n=1 Tax=Chroococcus sp. FPU101 TaxID=1974212 RepID=UPI001A8E3B21|nr:glycine betaine ABC transporter substrate-binding protein [Chroococcus sp. FPU101]GFE70467.1 Substrate-binding region of ABC-type glycine betaine transport system [Chroococcus sp. FPU101]
MPDFLIRYAPEIGLRTLEHLLLVGVAMSIAIAIGIPLGILITRRPNLAKPVLAVANTLQTIPSLALFGFLISVPFLGGIGKVPAIVALALYALLPLIRNTYVGITSIAPSIQETARAMGMTERQVLLRVELPLAMGVILAGVRIATVICVGIATIAAAIGGGGLGVFIFRGIATVNNQLILAGAVPSAILALIADWFIGYLEKSLTQTGRKKNKKSILLITGLILGSTGLSILVLSQTLGNTAIVIGSKNFTEQVILGEMLAQQIERKTGLKVERQLNLGGTGICHEAVKSGQLAGYVEYTGTALTTILKQPPLSDAKIVFQKVKQAYLEQFNLAVFPSLGFNNTFAIIIRSEDAQKYHLTKLSQVGQYTPQWQAGFGYEFLNREDGFSGLAKTYNLKFAQPPQAMDLGLIYRALEEKQVDLVAGNSTDGLIKILNLVILDDDKHYFPPYEAVPIFNQKTLDKYPKIRVAIDELAGKISAQDMQTLNYQVDGLGRPVAEVVNMFLKTRTFKSPKSNISLRTF